MFCTGNTVCKKRKKETKCTCCILRKPFHNDESTGRIVRIGPNEVSIRDIQAVKTVYSIRETFMKTKWYKDFTVPANNMFNTADAEYHRKSRRMLASAMSDTAIQKLSTRVGGHVNFAVDKMKAENSSRKVIDIYKWWLFMATDIIVEFTYGESFHMLEHGKVSGPVFHLILKRTHEDAGGLTATLSEKWI